MKMGIQILELSAKVKGEREKDERIEREKLIIPAYYQRLRHHISFKI